MKTTPYTFSRLGNSPVNVIHEIDSEACKHRISIVVGITDNGSSPWVDWKLPLTFDVNGRYFVAQCHFNTIPACFELIPTDEQTLEATGL